MTWHINCCVITGSYIPDTKPLEPCHTPARNAYIWYILQNHESAEMFYPRFQILMKWKFIISRSFVIFWRLQLPLHTDSRAQKESVLLLYVCPFWLSDYLYKWPYLPLQILLQAVISLSFPSKLSTTHTRDRRLFHWCLWDNKDQLNNGSGQLHNCRASSTEICLPSIVRFTIILRLL